MQSSLPAPCPRSACWFSVTVLCLASALFITLAGCATAPGGSHGVNDFTNDSLPVVLPGSRSATGAARCFEDQAKFLPLSAFSRWLSPLELDRAATLHRCLGD
jgi:hypothetical protein